MEKVRIGVIGAGGIFKGAHMPAYKELSDVTQVVWVCDRDEEAARRGAESLGARWTTRLEDVLEDDGIEAVDICTPKHREIIEAAASASKHILCEKPLEFTLEDCDACIEAAKRAGVILMVAENYLFDPVILEIERALNEGKLGELRRLRLFQGWKGAPASSWRRRRAMAGGGCLMDDGVHLIALARYFMGEPTEVQALVKRFGAPEGVDVENHAVVILDFSDGGIAVIEAGLDIQPGLFRFEFHGDRGSAFYEALYGRHELRIFSDVPYSPSVPSRFPSLESYRNEIAHFAECVLRSETPRYTGESSRREVELVLTAYRLSSSSGYLAGYDRNEVERQG
ncbi:Gfo/Idh/MocA family oxidoreductase [Candidatus Poribacteria bacterium]|nr:Gfo/Idh/MocA family oxidoreductase [Candidatus Poribacteria bacterium]